MRAWSSSRWSRSAAVLVAIGAIVLTAGGAHAQDGDGLPAVAVAPLASEAPNDGQWFAIEAHRGQTVEAVALLTNDADEAQVVNLYLADLEFGDDDDVAVGDPQAGVGGWGGFDTDEVSVPANSVERATFRVTVPDDADPGDHIGLVVADSAPTDSAIAGVGLIKRVAVRLYVTVPGDARPAVEVASVTSRPDRALLPRHLITTFVVRNTGNVRLEVAATVNGRPAAGPAMIVSRSGEEYEARVPVSVWGGRTPVEVRVETRTTVGEGPAASDSARVLIVPWWMLLAVFLAVVGAVTGRELRRRLG